MNPLEAFMVALALGCDAFAVGFGVGTRFCSPRQVFRLSFHFGFFQFIMPLFGWFLGAVVFGVARQWGPWIGFALLVFIGARMIHESMKTEEDRGSENCPDPTKGFSLVMLSVATSIDALGVGFSLGLLKQNLFYAPICIGITACLMTWAAMRLGNRLSASFGRRMETVGGLILISIGIKLLI